MFTFSIDRSDGYEQAKTATKARLRLLVGVVVAKAADEGVAEAKRVGRFRDRTGQLRGTLRRTPVRTSVGEAVSFLEAPAKYASFVESGTAPHEILPRDYHWGSKRARRPTSRVTGRAVSDATMGAGRGKALRFYIGGRVVFARRVNHPGTKPYPFIGPAYLKMQRLMPVLVDKGFERIQQDIWG